MPKPPFDIKAGATIPLPRQGGMPESSHIIDQPSIDAVNAALVTGRPLLVRGEPGTGKSQLARAVARHMKRAFVPHAVDSRTETRDLLWSVDAVARLARAQVLGALGHKNADKAMEEIAVIRFVKPGALWWGFDWKSAAAQAIVSGAGEPLTPEGWTSDRGVVVLVDEIDKADPSVPNGLLDALGHGRFDVEGGAPVAMDEARRPLIILTTNEERALPDAFLRRCWVLHLSLPAARDELIETLIVRGRAHFDRCEEAVLRKAAELLATDREELRSRDLSPPGLAEYIDLLGAVTRLADSPEPQLELLERIAKFAYRKHPPEQME